VYEVVTLIWERIFELGMEFAKPKIKQAKQGKELEDRLEKFINRKLKENYCCSSEEELDFAGIVEYISSTLLDDMRKYIYGNYAERVAARTAIISKAVSYSKANTKLSEKRAKKMISDAINIIHDFYRQKTNKDLLFLSAEIDNTVRECTAEQTQMIVKTIEENSRTQNLLSIDGNIQFINDGQVNASEKNITEFINALSSSHSLFPYYGFALETIDGKVELRSVPRTKDATIKYPQKIECRGTVKIGDKYIAELTSGAVEYANRHQLPIILNVSDAKSYLGDVLDPVQGNAQRLIGDEITLPPQPFPKAIPCSISFDDVVYFDYILFRIVEILDDGTIIVSNKEQTNCNIRISLKWYKDKKVDFTFNKDESENKEISLKCTQILKKAIEGTKMSIKILSTGELLAEGIIDNFKYSGAFSTIDEEIDFIDRVVEIEKYYNKVIELPEVIYQKDWEMVYYLSELIKGRACKGEWTKIEIPVDVRDKHKENFLKTEDKPFSLTYVGTVGVVLWEETYEIPIARTFDSGSFKDLEHIKQKMQVLDEGDSFIAVYASSDEIGSFNDVLYVSPYTD